ncbi:MAG: ECF transporter S component [Peptococcaceae bacterium]|jgi:hypothetical protein|nr:ECF transporter S component [Peptococcaceae bacterium]MDH7523957.1 ECF transporter S component [Peptococcaceae bacterium]
MKITTKMITRSALILALAIAVQSVRMPQFVTGPVVNALLFLAASLIGPVSAALIGLCTPVIAFAFGIMPLAPAVPVIILGNVTLALVFGYLPKNPYLGMIAAAVAKYGVMTLGVYYLLPLLLKINLPPKIVDMLTTPQLFTALGGGVLALVLLKALSWLKKG